jgi:hypothetical protein
MNELESRVVGKPWPKGVSGNPSGLPGRPAGSRQTFSAGFLNDRAKTWRDKGRQTMEWTADNQPSTFFAICARLIGPEVKVTIEQQLPGKPKSPQPDFRTLIRFRSAHFMRVF